MHKIQPMAQAVESAVPSARQSRDEVTVPDSDLHGLALEAGAKVLDAGCGAGKAARELAIAYPEAEIQACDLSDLQLKQAEKLAQVPGTGSVKYFKSSLEKIAREDSTYDAVVCRDVLAYVADPRSAAAEMLRVLKGGGVLRAIEFDGLFCNLFPATPRLRAMLEKLERDLPSDLRVGRKLPGLLEQAGFREVSWEITAVSFQGDALAREARVTEQRLALAARAIGEALGSAACAEEFRRLYLDEMLRPGAVVFYNKFVVRARK